MFEIYDGRENFYQWDLNRKLIVIDSSITQVHYCNRTDDCSLICDVYEEDGKRVVNVPNILLQTDWDINVYGYDKNYTKHSTKFRVQKRTKPADYVYTETEVKNYDDLEERVTALEKGGVSGGGSCVCTQTEKIEKNTADIGDISKLSQYGSNIADIILKLISGGVITPDEEEVIKQALPCVYLTGDMSGISGDDYVNVLCHFVDSENDVEFTDYAEVAWQGSSSLTMPRKNFKIKLYKDEARSEKNKRVFKDWHETNNYHLKCNYGDCTNFMNNMMMNYLTKSYQYLTPLPREGARYTVDGFPILLYTNDAFAGIYFWNLKQDDKVYNLNEDDLCYQAGRADNYNNAGNNSCAFVYGALNANGLSFTDARAEIDYYWEDRVWDKVDNHPEVLYNTIQWVSEATDEEFKANLSKYFDVDYLINYFVCIYTCAMIDSKAKNFNMLYFPEKGVWYPTFWDMDKAFGSGFNTGTVPYTVKFTPETSNVYEFDAPASRLFDKLIVNFWDEICAKYHELRQTLFTVEQVEDSVNAVWGNVTDEMLAENKAVKYDGTSYTGFKVDGADFVLDWAAKRFAFMDGIFTNTDTPEEDANAYAEGYIDASGNIVSSVGNYYTVGYTAVEPNTTIVVKADAPFNSWRVCIYDENKNFIRRVVATDNATVNIYKTGAITLAENEKYLRFSAAIKTTTDVPIVFDTLQVTENTWAMEYADGYIDASGNIVQESKSFYTVDYAEVAPNTTITVSDKSPFSAWRVCLYDENKNFIRRVVAADANTQVYETDAITLADNEKYLRFSANIRVDILQIITSLEVKEV